MVGARQNDLEAAPLMDEKHVPQSFHAPSTRRRPIVWSTRSFRRDVRRISPSRLLTYSIKLSRMLLRGLLYFLIGSAAVSLFFAIFMPVYSKLPASYRVTADLAVASESPGRANPNNTKVFIASTQLEGESIRNHWAKSLSTLVDLLGSDNVFVSIYDTNSSPETQKAISELNETLACNKSIVTGSHVKLQDLPQIEVPSGQHGVKRSEYLAYIRNRSLRPIDPPKFRTNTSSEPGLVWTNATFDRILFLDNVYFDPVDAAHLILDTRRNPVTGAPNYEAACAADFTGVGTFASADVTRDTDGFALGYPKFPWFSLSGSHTSRLDVTSGRDAVRVRSCWGGMVSFDAAHFQKQESRELHSDEDSGAGRFDHTAMDGLLRFRSDNELYWDASERCLISADVSRRHRAVAGKDVADTGIYLNPYIRVAHTASAWSYMNLLKRFEHSFVPMQYTFTILGMYPRRNERRKEVPGNMVDRVQWFYFSPEYLQENRGRDGAWLDKTVLSTPGSFCGLRQMSVMGNEFEVPSARKEKGYTVFQAPKGWWRGI